MTTQQVKCDMISVMVVLFCFCRAVGVGEMKEILEMSYILFPGDFPGGHGPSPVGGSLLYLLKVVGNSVGSFQTGHSGEAFGLQIAVTVPQRPVQFSRCLEDQMFSRA